MSENGSPAGQLSWYVVSANSDVVAGPLADKAAADRLALLAPCQEVTPRERKR
jgi:hypothetical protein